MLITLRYLARNLIPVLFCAQAVRLSSLKRFLGSIVALDGLRHNRASRVTALVVGRLGRYDSGDIAARHRHHRP